MTTEAVRALIGRRVRHQHTSHCGVITRVEPGCNTLVRVQFDGRDYDVAIVPADLIFEGPSAHNDTNVGAYLFNNAGGAR